MYRLGRATLGKFFQGLAEFSGLLSQMIRVERHVGFDDVWVESGSPRKSNSTPKKAQPVFQALIRRLRRLLNTARKIRSARSAGNGSAVWTPFYARQKMTE